MHHLVDSIGLAVGIILEGCLFWLLPGIAMFGLFRAADLTRRIICISLLCLFLFVIVAPAFTGDNVVPQLVWVIVGMVVGGSLGLAKRSSD